jgi:hypothetical protein
MKAKPSTVAIDQELNDKMMQTASKLYGIKRGNKKKVVTIAIEEWIAKAEKEIEENKKKI